MQRWELEKLAGQYLDVYPEPSPLDVTDAILRVERALNGLRYVQITRQTKTGEGFPMFRVNAIFRTAMMTREKALDQVQNQLDNTFAGSKVFKAAIRETENGFDCYLLALCRPEAPVNGLVMVRAA